MHLSLAGRSLRSTASRCKEPMTALDLTLCTPPAGTYFPTPRPYTLAPRRQPDTFSVAQHGGSAGCRFRRAIHARFNLPETHAATRSKRTQATPIALEEPGSSRQNAPTALWALGSTDATTGCRRNLDLEHSRSIDPTRVRVRKQSGILLWL